jgi:hypothetical protein
LGKGKAVEKILAPLVCGVIFGCVVSMTPCIILIVVMVIIPGSDRFYEASISIACPLATLLSVVFFCYLEFIRKPRHSGTEDSTPGVYQWIGFAGEIIGACFPIVIWLR